MSLPGIELNVVDGQLGIQAGTGENVCIFMGVCTDGDVNVLQSFGDSEAMQDALGLGALVECGAYNLGVAGGPQQFMALSASTRGGIGTVTHSGTSPGAVTASAAPHLQIVMTITTSGALSTAAATFSVGGGAASSPVTLTGTPYRVPGTYTVLTFNSGSYVLGEIYTVFTDATISQGATGPTISQASSPIDDYDVLVSVTLSGARGTAQFTYSLDGGGSTSSEIVTAATYVIPSTGIVLAFSNSTYLLDDTWSFKTAGPTFNSTDLANAFNALSTTYAASIGASLAYVIGGNSSATNWATQAASLATYRATLFNKGIYLRIWNECPTVGTVLPNSGSITVDSADTDATIIAVAQALNYPAVVASAGDEKLTSPLNGLGFRRNNGWSSIARALDNEASQNIGFVQLGGVPGVTELYRDEDATPGLDAARFVTMRTFPGVPGFYITDGHTMALTTSDYSRLTNARVVDLGCGLARTAAIPQVNGKIPTTTGGVITELKAQQIEALVQNSLDTGLVTTEPQNAVASRVVVNRTHNILSDGNLILNVGIQPFAYARLITVNIGLVVSA